MKKATKTPNLRPIMAENNHTRARARVKIFYKDILSNSIDLNSYEGRKITNLCHNWQPLTNYRQGEYIREYRRYLSDNKDVMVLYRAAPLGRLIGLDKRLTFPNDNLNAQKND